MIGLMAAATNGLVDDRRSNYPHSTRNGLWRIRIDLICWSSRKRVDGTGRFERG